MHDRPRPARAAPAPCAADDGRSFWPVFVTADGEPTPAWVVAEKLADRTGRITDEVIGDSFEIVGDLRNVARGGFATDEFDAAWNALKAERRLRNAETRDRYEARFPEGPWSGECDMSYRRPKPIPHMLTIGEVAELFRVSEATVTRESRAGGSLPQPIRVGSQQGAAAAGGAERTLPRRTGRVPSRAGALAAPGIVRSARTILVRPEATSG